MLLLLNRINLELKGDRWMMEMVLMPFSLKFCLTNALDG